MCKKSIDDSVAESCDCSNPDYPWTVDAEPKNTIEEVYELFNGNPTIGAMLEVYDDELDQIAPLICSLTNDVLPLFDEQNVCVCVFPDKQYCYLPENIAEMKAAEEELGNNKVPDWELCSMDGITNRLEGSLLPHWDHDIGESMLRSAMQLATRMITHEDALLFWAGLMDCAKSGKDGERTRLTVPAGERLDAAKKQEVLEYLQQATRRIRIHLKSFYMGEENVTETCGGFCCAFPLEQDGSDKSPDQPKTYYGWQNGQPALQEGYFQYQ